MAKTNHLTGIWMLWMLSMNLCLYAQNKTQKFLFPDHKKSAVCLTYDDGMATHLANAIPQLDEAGIKGTFYLNSASGQSTVAGWIHAANKGHELGNHSIFHPCPSGMGWPPELETDHYTIPKILDEIKATDGILKLLDPSHAIRTYAYPCNNIKVNGASYVAHLKKSKLVKYARGGGKQVDAVIQDFKHLNLMEVPSFIVNEDSEASILIEAVERLKQQGGLLVFQFHGIGGQWIKVSNETHMALLKYLKDHEKEIWIAPFREVVGYIDKKR